MFWVSGLGLRVEGFLGFGVWGWGFGVWGLGFLGWGVYVVEGFGVLGFWG